MTDFKPTKSYKMILAGIPLGDGKYGIGYKGDMSWRCPPDMKMFRETTAGAVVIMGRKTWDSIPPKFRPLEGRVNIVISKNSDKQLRGEGGSYWVRDPLEAYAKAEECVTVGAATGIFVIGGAQIYNHFVDTWPLLLEKFYLTEIETTAPTDTTVDLAELLSVRPDAKQLATGETVNGIPDATGVKAPLRYRIVEYTMPMLW